MKPVGEQIIRGFGIALGGCAFVIVVLILRGVAAMVGAGQ